MITKLLVLNNGKECVLKTGLKLSPVSFSLSTDNAPFASIVSHPTDPSSFGLKNDSTSTWKAVTASGKRNIAPGQILKAAEGTEIDFGFLQGTITSAASKGTSLPVSNLTAGPNSQATSANTTPKSLAPSLGALGQMAPLQLQPQPAVAPIYQPASTNLNFNLQQAHSGDVTLTEDEKRVLLWEKNDFFEIISGSISITSSRQFRMVASERATLHTEISFFFQSNNPAWPTRECSC